MWFYYPIVNENSILTEVVANNFQRDVRRLPFFKNSYKNEISCEFGFISKDGKDVNVDTFCLDPNSSRRVVLNKLPPDETLALGYCRVEAGGSEGGGVPSFNCPIETRKTIKHVPFCMICSLLKSVNPVGWLRCCTKHGWEEGWTAKYIWFAHLQSNSWRLNIN